MSHFNALRDEDAIDYPGICPECWGFGKFQAEDQDGYWDEITCPSCDGTGDDAA